MKSNTAAYFVGLDLGSLAEFTGLAVIERPQIPPDVEFHQRRPVHSLRHLQRFPPGTSYLEVVEAVRVLFSEPVISGSILIVDQTGVGKAVTDWMADELRGKFIGTYAPVGISAGHSVVKNDYGLWLIPKKELAGNLQILLQTQRLHVARTLPDVAILVKELENLKGYVSA
jgi:hypothetical protein